MGKVYHHPGQEQMQVEVILASRHADCPDLPPLYTIRLRYPRIIHGEIMTHRVFSRNARSSRAVPVKTMLLECTSIPFIPWHWGKNQKGMQADEECNELVRTFDRLSMGSDDKIETSDMSRERAWLNAGYWAIETATAYMNAGYHKQIVNRLLEPFSWIDVLITANDWENFLWLRDHGDAEPHLQDLARLVKQAIDEAEIQTLKPGEWHLPYITDADRHQLLVDSGRLAGDRYAEITGTDNFEQWLKLISAARCARISYKPFDGDASYEREFERYNLLVTSDRVHASPTEHQATPDTRVYVDSFIYETEDVDGETIDHDCEWGWAIPEQHGNFTGFIQARKLIPNEAIKMKVAA